MEERIEQLVHFPFYGREASVVELPFANAHRRAAIVGKANARLLRTKVHDHDPQLDRGGRLLLGAKGGRELIAGELDPGAEQGRKFAPRDGVEKFRPLRVAIAAAAKELPLVLRAEAAADLPGVVNQAEIVVRNTRLNPAA